MKQNKTIAQALILSACLLFITTFSFAQLKTDRVTKGYYSIYNNTKKLNLSAGRKVFSNKAGDWHSYESNTVSEPRKGYYAIGRNAEKKRTQMAIDSFDFFNEAPSGIITKSPFPVITKGYYSIGRNAEKLQK